MAHDTNITNFASNLRWVCNIPFNILFKEEQDVKLSLTQFDIPDVEVGTTEASYQGYAMEVPTGVIQPSEKNVSFSYILDNDMRTYWLLYRWASMFTKDILPTVDGEDDEHVDISDKLMTIFVIILDEWKKPTFRITYHDCWIKSFGNLSMSYQDEPQPLEHEFTLVYSKFEVEEIATT